MCVFIMSLFSTIYTIPTKEKCTKIFSVGIASFNSLMPHLFFKILACLTHNSLISEWVKTHKWGNCLTRCSKGGPFDWHCTNWNIFTFQLIESFKFEEKSKVVPLPKWTKIHIFWISDGRSNLQIWKKIKHSGESVFKFA